MEMSLIFSYLSISLVLTMIVFYTFFEKIKKICLTIRNSPINNVTVIRSNKIRQYGLDEDIRHSRVAEVNETDILLSEYDMV